VDRHETTTQTMTTPEAIGRSLAAIAVEVNDFGPPTYRKYIWAFEQAYPVLKQARELGPAKIKDEVIAAFDKHVEELLEFHGIG
jgi:hypothetical protein